MTCHSKSLSKEKNNVKFILIILDSIGLCEVSQHSFESFVHNSQEFPSYFLVVASSSIFSASRLFIVWKSRQWIMQDRKGLFELINAFSIKKAL